MPITVGRALVDSLEAHDIDLIYCVPGESYLGFTNALADNNRMRLIVCRHEGGAAFMAAADGRMRGGRAGVVVVSRGPGLSNALIGLHTAFHDATPLVVLIGQVERWEAGRQALQEQNYSRLLCDITKLVIEVNEPNQASEAIARAFHIAESGTPGPVAVVIPEDVFDCETDAPLAKPRPAAQGGPLPDDIERLASMLAASERPLIWVGTAMRPAEIPDLTRLVEDWVLPVSPTHRRPHLFDAGHPNYAGYMASRIHADALAEYKKGRPADRAGRADHRHHLPGFHLPRRARSATAAGACLAGPERGRPRLAPRSRHGLRTRRGGAGAVGARRAGRRGEAARLGVQPARGAPASDEAGLGNDARWRQLLGRDRGGEQTSGG